MALSMHFSPVYFRSQSSQQQEDMSEHDLASHRMLESNGCQATQHCSRVGSFANDIVHNIVAYSHTQLLFSCLPYHWQC